MGKKKSLLEKIMKFTICDSPDCTKNAVKSKDLCIKHLLEANNDINYWIELLDFEFDRENSEFVLMQNEGNYITYMILKRLAERIK